MLAICLICERGFEKRGPAVCCSKECSKKRERQRRKAYYHCNPEKAKNCTKAWKEANPEKRAIYEKANPENRARRRKAWREANREKERNYAKAWREANPEKSAFQYVNKYLKNIHNVKNPPEELVAAIVEMRKIKRELKEQQL